MAENVLRHRFPGNAINESTALLEESAEAGIELESLGTAEGVTYAFEAAETAGLALDETGIGAPIGLAIGLLSAAGYGAYKIYEHFHNAGIAEHKIPKVSQIQQHINNNNNKIQEHKEYIKSQGINLPFSNYIGPGNALENGPPQNLADQAAKVHDHAYDKAVSYQDVYDADEALKQDFQIRLLETNNPIERIQSAVGYGGIALKNKFERQFGVKYPSNLSGKQWHHLIIEGSSMRRNSLKRTHNIRTLSSQINGSTSCITLTRNTFQPIDQLLHQLLKKDLQQIAKTL